jgi:hypothetical protein
MTWYYLVLEVDPRSDAGCKGVLEAFQTVSKERDFEE